MDDIGISDILVNFELQIYRDYKLYMGAIFLLCNY